MSHRLPPKSMILGTVVVLAVAAMTGALVARIAAHPPRPRLVAASAANVPQAVGGTSLVSRRVGKAATGSSSATSARAPHRAVKAAAHTRALQRARKAPAIPSIRIPALSLYAPIWPAGINRAPGERGTLAVPPNPSVVGWWSGGPAPGNPGVAVLAGHRASGGAFWRISGLPRGATIKVTGTNGRTTIWRVTRVRQMLKARLPTSIWVRGGPPKLVLVTCGGTFNPHVGHFNDNVVVWARPA